VLMPVRIYMPVRTQYFISENTHTGSNLNTPGPPGPVSPLRLGYALLCKLTCPAVRQAPDHFWSVQPPQSTSMAIGHWQARTARHPAVASKKAFES
jgi:hypothetical protein